MDVLIYRETLAINTKEYAWYIIGAITKNPEAESEDTDHNDDNDNLSTRRLCYTLPQLGFWQPEKTSPPPAVAAAPAVVASALAPDAGPGPQFETPQDGVHLRVPVMEGDLVILATDGLFDNVVRDNCIYIHSYSSCYIRATIPIVS